MGDPQKMDGVVIIIYNMIMEHPILTWMGVPYTHHFCWTPPDWDDQLVSTSEMS